MGEAVVRQDTPAMEPAEFARWQKLIEVRTGMYLPAHRQAFLQLALGVRMRELGINDYNAYFVYLRDGAQAAFEWTCLVDLLTVHETRFFRHPESFDLVRQFVRQRIAAVTDARASLQVWSVGCATGEETYSLVLALQELQDEVGAFYFGVTGTDISYPALSCARDGIYHQRRLIGVSDTQREKYFQPCGDDYFQVIPALRQRACFVQGNVNEPRTYPRQQFDIIFCQNLLIYFQNARRRELLDQFSEHLRPGGLLVLAPGEVLRWQHPLLTRLQNKHCLAYSHRG